MNNTPFSSKISKYIDKHALIERGSTIVVGLSGGPDSVTLLHVLCELKEEYKLTLIAAHIDHGWRPESVKEAEFCRKLCDEWGVRIESRKLSDVASDVKFNGSREEYARRIRRHIFTEIGQQSGASAIALGHHADDQQETFFIRLIRGASLTGLVGMRPKHGLYIRPLLGVNKQEILDYLAERTLSYVTDASNDSDAYLRNRVRHTLVPAFKSVDSRALMQLQEVMQQLQQLEDYLTTHTDQLWQVVSQQEGDRWFIDIKQLLDLPVSMRHRLYVKWLIMMDVPFVPTQRFFAEIEKFLRTRNDVAQHQLHQSWVMYKKKSKAYVNTVKASQKLNT